MEYVIEGPLYGQADVCAPVLRSLSEWFGIEEANQQYLRDIEVLPTFLAFAEGCVLGFLTLKLHTEAAAEIHVMGVCQHAQRRGVGRALLNAAEAFLRSRGVLYLQVKTLSAHDPSEHYARTRAFYRASGFVPLEEFPNLWGPDNPCLQMIKKL